MSSSNGLFNKEIPKEELEWLIEDVRSIKLANLDKGFIEYQIKRAILKNPKILKKILEAKKHSELRRSSVYKKFIKEIRRNCNIAYGMFITKEYKKLNLYLNELERNPDSLEIYNKILSLHKSTKERLNNYDKIYKKVLDNKTKSILDIGSGLNIFSYPYINRAVKYYAADLDVDIIKRYFKIMSIRGKGIKVNLLDLEKVKFPKADVCFLFKVLESIDIKGHKNSENLIKKINCSRIVVSFSLKTLDNREMKFQRRAWFEKMLNRLNYKFKSFKTENEIFYIIEK